MLRLVLAAGLSVLALAAFAPGSAHAAECPAVTVDGVRVVELTDEHGCDQGAELAAAAVLDGGYLQDDTYYCRWGQGGTRPIKRKGRTFYAGFCMDKGTDAEATFLARPPLEICRESGLDDLRARYVGCSTARKVYRHSLKIAAARGGTGRVRFSYLGFDWTCRARNPHHRNGNPAWYEWKCKAPHDALVNYRWLAGE